MGTIAAAPAAPHALSRTLQEQITQLRDDFTPYVRTFDALRQRKAQLARPFMAAYRQWRRETGRSFIGFVQALDPDVPATKARYVEHPSYISALYLRRLVDAPQTIAGHAERKTMPPLQLLAVVIKSALPMVRPHEVAFWSSIAKTSRWQQRDLQRLQARVRTARSIPLRPDVPRLVHEGRRQIRMTAVPLAAASESSALR